MTDKELKYIEGIGWRYDIEHSMLRRRIGHDYTSRCIYMVTLSQADRSVPLFGRLEWVRTMQPSCTEQSQPSCTEQNQPSCTEQSQPSCTGQNQLAERKARFLPSDLGQKVSSEWYALSNEYPQIKILRLQMMPDHLHVVLFVKEPIPLHLGKIIGKVKNRSNKHYWAMLTAQGRLGAKGTETPPPLFSANFQDSILSHSGQLESMIRYVEDNPYRALVKRENKELFRVVSELKVKVAAQQRDYKAAQPSCTEQNHPSCTEQNQPSCTEQSLPSSEEGTLTFAAIGNRWLLDRPMRMQVRCHNSKSSWNLQLVERQKEYFLDRAEAGGVIVSPCISDGEKQIARAALDAGLPLIVILENGFPPMYKPPGKYFEACAKGQLLMLAPWSHHNERRTITRSQCLQLNEMAKALSTEPWTQELEELMNK